MEKLEIGESVEYGTGMVIERLDEYSYKISDGIDEITLRQSEIQTLAQVAGFIGREKADVDAW